MSTDKLLAIHVEGLTKRYGASTVVDNLSFRLERGKILGLIGPNGAGKSTTIRMLMGLLPISSGRAVVLGHDIAAEPLAVKSKVGYVPELHHQYRWMRVDELIGFTQSFYPTWNHDVCASLCDLFRIERHKKIRHLSKGTLAKVSLLLALSHDPDVLILDEPMAGLDPIAREEFLEGVLQTVSSRECAVLFSSHTLSDVQRMADDIAMLYEGKLLIHAPVDELLTSAKRVRAVLRDGCLPRWQPPEMICQRVDRREWLLTVNPFSSELLQKIQADCPIDHVEVSDLSLEDIFKDYVKGRRTPA